MFSFLTQFGAGSGIGALGLDGKAFIIQLITFVLAIFVLKKWAVGPIVKMMEQRRETIEQGVTLGEKMKKEQTEMEAKVEAALAGARSEADKIIASAHDTAREQLAEAEAKAREKADQILDEAADRIKRDAAASRQQIEGEVLQLISEATEAIIDEKIDAKKDAGLLGKVLRTGEAK